MKPFKIGDKFTLGTGCDAIDYEINYVFEPNPTCLEYAYRLKPILNNSDRYTLLPHSLLKKCKKVIKDKMKPFKVGDKFTHDSNCFIIYKILEPNGIISEYEYGVNKNNGEEYLFLSHSALEKYKKIESPPTNTNASCDGYIVTYDNTGNIILESAILAE